MRALKGVKQPPVPSGTRVLVEQIASRGDQVPPRFSRLLLPLDAPHTPATTGLILLGTKLAREKSGKRGVVNRPLIM